MRTRHLEVRQNRRDRFPDWSCLVEDGYFAIPILAPRTSPSTSSVPRRQRPYPQQLVRDWTGIETARRLLNRTPVITCTNRCGYSVLSNWDCYPGVDVVFSVLGAKCDRWNVKMLAHRGNSTRDAQPGSPSKSCGVPVLIIPIGVLANAV